MIDIEIQISISDISSGWATNYIIITIMNRDNHEHHTRRPQQKSNGSRHGWLTLSTCVIIILNIISFLLWVKIIIGIPPARRVITNPASAVDPNLVLDQIHHQHHQWWFTTIIWLKNESQSTFILINQHHPSQLKDFWYDNVLFLIRQCLIFDKTMSYFW